MNDNTDNTDKAFNLIEKLGLGRRASEALGSKPNIPTNKVPSIKDIQEPQAANSQELARMIDKISAMDRRRGF